MKKKNEKVEHVKNVIGKPEVSKEAESYYEQLKAKYGDAEFVLVADEKIGNAKKLMSNVQSDKELVVFISESELEAMAKDEAVRGKNEQFIADAIGKMPSVKQQLKEAGVEVKSFGMEFNKDGTVSYFAVLDKFAEAQKDRIESQKEDKKEKKDTVVSASSIEELIKKIKDKAYEAKADSVMTEQEKMLGQHLDIKF